MKRPTILFLLLTAPLCAQGPWTELSGTIETSGVLAVDEGGSRLEARGTDLVRTSDEGEITLRELPDRPTGPVHALARDPHGGTFVAAEHGLFLAHPSVDTIDRLDLKEGVPPGAPVGIVLDRDRRLWVATRTHFGVLHTGFFYGRTHTKADGLPDGPYTGLRAHQGGGLVLALESGAVWRYQPDQGQAPTVTDVTIDGRPYDGAATLARTWPVRVELRGQGSGTGGATLRWVTDAHHNWHALPGSGREIGDEMNPGKRTIHVVAFDRDLRRSAESVIPISVAYPTWLRPAYLLGGVILAVAVTLVWLLRRARRAGGGRVRYTRASLTTVILWWLILQIAAGVFPHARGWPFCGFSMYTGTTKENAISGPVMLVRTDARGREHPASLKRFDLVVDTHWQILRPFMNGDEAFKRRMLDRYNAYVPKKGPKPPPSHDAHALRVVHKRTRLTREGKIPVAPLVMAAVEKRP